MAGPRKSKSDKVLWWMEGWAFDSRGIGYWHPIFCTPDERRCRTMVKQAERMSVADLRRQCIDRYTEFRAQPPGRDHYADMKKADKKAAKGICPSCGKKPGKHRSGTKAFHKALKCSKCGHVWCLPGTVDVEALHAHRAEIAEQQRIAKEKAARLAQKAIDSAMDDLKKKSKKDKKKKRKKSKKSKKKK